LSVVKWKRPDRIVVTSLPIHVALEAKNQDQGRTKRVTEFSNKPSDIAGTFSGLSGPTLNTEVGSTSARRHVAGASHGHIPLQIRSMPGYPLDCYRIRAPVQATCFSFLKERKVQQGTK
jgi:hypothetical protein